MRTYVVEIDGRPVQAFRAEDDAMAEDMAEDEDGPIRESLLLMDSPSGDPIWDGYSPLRVRRATTEEHEQWAAARDQAMGPAAEGNPLDPTMRDDPDDLNVWLVPVVDPIDDMDDDHD